MRTQILGHGKHPELRERDKRVAGLYVVKINFPAHAHERRFAQMPDLLPRVAGALNDADQKIARLGRGAEMHLRREHAEDRARPGKAALPVGDHLALVDHRHIVPRGEIELFRRGGDVGIPLAAVLFLAGRERARNAEIKQPLLRFKRQQTERSKIYARFGFAQPLKPGVGLAGIRPAGMENKMALHGARFRVLVLRVECHEQLQARADRARDIKDRIEIGERVLQKLLHGKGALFEKPIHVRLRLRGSKRSNVARTDRKQHRGIARGELPGERRSCVRAEPWRGGHEPAERCAERLGAGAGLQMEKVLDIADALSRPQPLGKSDRRDLAEDRFMVARRERRFTAFRQRGGIPCAFQKLRRCIERRIIRYAFRIFGRRRAQRAEALALLGAADIVRAPGTHAAAVSIKTLRLRQERGDQLLRPAAAFERARRP